MRPDTSDLPVAVRLSWWGTGRLRGHIADDGLTGPLLGSDLRHLVVSAPNADPSIGSLPTYLDAELAAGGDAVFGAFPAPGDPVGLRGPAALTAAAIDAGQAVLLPHLGVGLVPHQVGAVVEWHPYEAQRPLPLDLGEADRGLRAALLRAADGLAALDVASWSPDLADALIDLRGSLAVPEATWVPDRCRTLLATGLHLSAVVELALVDDGGALGAAQAARRRDLIEQLSGAVRRALTACCSPEGWPPATR